MKHFSKRVLALVLVLCTVVTLLAGLTVTASAAEPTSASQVNYRKSGKYVYNWGKRDTTATFLTTYAQSYYTGSYSYATLSSKSGSTSTGAADIYSSALGTALHNMLVSKQTYTTSYKGTTSLYCYTDCEQNADKISSYYSGTLIGPKWDGGKTWNREHTWPNSKGLDGSDENDIMMLRPTSTKENGDRGNNAYGTGSGYYDPNKLGENLRGDVARLMLQHLMRWGNTSKFYGSGGVIENRALLLRWLEEDPVDTWEMGRNDAVQAITGVRNVFVDYPELAFKLLGVEVPANYPTPLNGGKTVSFKLTAVSDDESRGTVSVSGMTITATPKTGCKVDDANPYTVTPTGAATVTRNGNVFTVSGMKSDCTVKINFAQKQAATVIFHTPSGTSFSGVSAAGMVSTYVGDSITLPSVTGKPNGTDYTFCGWATAAVGETTTAPSLRAASSSYTVTGSLINFYAVFSLTKDGKTYYNSEPKPAVTCAHEHTKPQHKDATCTEDGYDRVVCKDCGMELSGTTIPATGHSFKEGVCTVCGAPDPDYKPTCKHEHTKNETQDATCTVGGYDRTVCTDCGKELSVSSKPALGHEYKDGKCIRCGAAQPDEKPVNHPKYTDFADLPVESWYKEGVSYALDRGLMNGVGSREFDPDGNVTRAMFVTILYRAENTPSVEGKSNPFTDVQNGKWYTEAVIWASDRGIVKGTSETTYSPDAPITREQIATILFRYSKSSPSDKSLSSFPDAGTVSSYAQNGICWAVAEGIINGKDGKLAPKENATRCQIAAILMRYLEK